MISQKKKVPQTPASSISPNPTGLTLGSLVGNEYVEELVTPSNAAATGQPREWIVGDDGVNTKELKRIHEFLSETTRPSWHTPPPSNLGEASHGSLKADELRSSIEFDVPAALAQIWDHDTQQSKEDKGVRRQKKLFHATMLLATAIRWATSYLTSELHAAQYMICMTAYLNTLKELYPNFPWRPNHHTALHIGPFLLLFGPMHGWWMFVFERVIGKLQKISTNYKLGELGITILYRMSADVSA
jgi:hypothetical protein